MTILDIENTIGFLNADIYQVIGLDYELGRFTVESDGFAVVIKFLGIQVWTSEDDMRDEYEDGVKESLNSYLQRQALAMFSRLKDVDF